MTLRNLIVAMAALHLALTAAVRAADSDVRKKIAFFDIFNAVESAAGDPMHPAAFRITDSGQASITLTVERADPDHPVTIPIFGLDNPPLKSGPYSLRGNVAYGGFGLSPDLGGVAYLELWSTFTDGRSFFTRTLAGEGPMKKFAGHSLARPFNMPFRPDPGMSVTNLVLNLVMTGPGSVTLSGAGGQDGLLLEQDDSAALDSRSASTDASEIAARTNTLQSDYARFGRSFLVDEDERRLLEAERRLNEHVMANDWTQRFTIPLEMDVRTSWWFLVGGLVVAAGTARAASAAGESAGAIRGVSAFLGLAAFGWGMAAVGRGLLAGVSIATGGLVVLAGALVVTPWLLGRRRSVELRRMELLDVA